MSLSVLPIWTGYDGADTSTLGVTCRDVADAESEVAKWLDRKLPGMRVVVSDDVTWRRVMTVRAKVTPGERKKTAAKVTS